jgi:hypothetical protein
MMFNEIKSGDIPILSFLKGTDYAMYVGPDLNPRERQQLKSKDIPVPVIYLPEILEQLSESVLGYNFPGVVLPESLSVESIYAQIRAEFDGRVTPESRLIVKYNGDVLVIYDAKDCFSLVISYLINMCKPASKRKVKITGIRFNKISRFDDSLLDLYESLDEESPFKEEPAADLSEPEGIRFRISESREESRRENKEEILFSTESRCREMLSEESFDEEMQNALKEAEEMIKGLLLKGCPTELILSWLNQNVKLSRLRITKHYKILLVDYDKEIKMGPLPKTVFLFFLRHPEGVMFSHLQDYKQELKEIYGRVCTNDDLEKMEQSISRLTDPFDNSICEKCAAVKKAFVMNVSDTIAKNYYVNGSQGEKKSISLDRNLVEWECEL